MSDPIQVTCPTCGTVYVHDAEHPFDPSTHCGTCGQLLVPDTRPLAAPGLRFCGKDPIVT